MAVVGNAQIVVSAITNPFAKQVAASLDGVARIGFEAGKNTGRSFQRGFNQNKLDNLFSRVNAGLSTLAPNASRAQSAFATLSRTGYVAGTAVSALVSSVGALVGGLGAFIGVAGGAAGSLAALGSAGFAAAAGMVAARLALGGVGGALSKLNKASSGGGGGGSGAAAAAAAAKEAANKRVEDAERSLALTIERNRENLIDANNAVRDAQLALNDALKEGREEIQQLGFDAEDAALDEQKAALELEKARERLAKVQDLPPNSRARREAELAYQEAELNYRKAKDSAADLAAEQDRLAKTGVAGTDAVVNATQRLADAEADKAKTVRDALRDQEDAERNLADAKKDAAKAGKDGGGGGGGGGADPFEGLNAAQIAFVKRLQELKDEFDELKRVAAENFLPPLADALDTLFDRSGVVFPVFRDGIASVAKGMGSAAVSIANSIAESGNLKDLASSLTQSGKFLSTAGVVIGKAWGVVITIIERAFPIAQRYFEFLEKRLDAFDKWMDTDEGSDKMEDFFKKSADAMAQFGRIFDNIFGGIGAVITANLGPGTGGGYLLDWLEKATQKFNDLDKDAASAKGLKDYFLGAATNMQKMFSAVGALLAEIIKVGDNPNIGKMWDTLAEGAPILGSIIQKMTDAGPIAAEVVKKFLEIADVFTDTVSANIFFGTLLEVLTSVKNFLDNEFVKSILAVVGPILAMTLAFGVVGRAASFFGNVVVGSVMKIIAPFSAFLGWVAKASQFFAVLTYSGSGLAATIGRVGFALMNILKFAVPVLGIIGLLVTAFTIMYKHNEQFRESVDNMVKSLMPILQQFMAALQQVFAALMPVIQQAMSQIMAAVQQLLPVLMTAFQSIINAILPLIPLLLNALLPAFLSIIKAIAPLIPMLIGALVPALLGIVQAIVPLVTQIIGALVPALTSILNAVLPVITMLIESLVPVIVTVVEAIVPLITTILDALVPAITMIFEAVAPLITQLIDALVPIIKIVIEVFKLVLPIIVDLIKQGIEVLIPIIKFLVEAFKNLLIPIIQAVVNIIKTILTPIIQGIITVLKGVIDFIKNVFTGNWKGAWESLVGIFRGIVNTIISIFEGMVNFIIDGINGFLGALNGVGDWVSDITGGAININVGKLGHVHIPRMEHGGTVMPSRGGSIVNVAEAGKPERIEPLDANGLSTRDKAMIDYMSNGRAGTTINVYQQPGEDGEAFAKRVSQLISKDMRMGALV